MGPGVGATTSPDRQDRPGTEKRLGLALAGASGGLVPPWLVVILGLTAQLLALRVPMNTSSSRGPSEAREPGSMTTVREKLGSSVSTGSGVAGLRRRPGTRALRVRYELL